MGSKKDPSSTKPVVMIESAGRQVNRLWFPKKWEVVPVLDPLAPFIADGHSARTQTYLKTLSQPCSAVFDKCSKSYGD